MKDKHAIPPAAELRQSQIITTFGPGAMVDLPDRSVLIGGLDFWEGDMRRIFEDRLEQRVAEVLGLDSVALYAPPVDTGDGSARRTGITSFVFPTWFVAQVDQTFTSESGQVYRTRPLVRWDRLVQGGYLREDRKIATVVPVRFVQACVKGHISDLDWYGFVRRDFETQRVGALWLDEGGAGNDFSEIFVRCEMTRMRRPLSDATIPEGGVLGRCQGRQPWLGPQAWERCDEYNRFLVRSASNAYFARTLSTIHIPDTDAALRQAVDGVYEDFLQYAQGVADVRRERIKQKVFVALEGFEDEAVWAEVARRKQGAAAERKSIKQLEIETLLAQPEGTGEDQPDGDFYARARSLDGLPAWLGERVERIVLVHRLREVMAQVGFTRFEPSVTTIEGELDDELALNVEAALLAREPTWVPAVENQGEGVFIAFRPAAVHAWLERPAVIERGRRIEAGCLAWCRRKSVERSPFPGLPYLMLHSLSHLLITAVSLECGYAASAIRERVYAGGAGYGILLYTGAPGSEGTLGGLVDVGRVIEQHLARALELGGLCSNDPVCAQHDPDHAQEERYLHGAACHGCLLIAETSCERRNELLDRALVIPTVATREAAFFAGAGPEVG
jgi:hypothetical protein